MEFEYILREEPNIYECDITEEDYKDMYRTTRDQYGSVIPVRKPALSENIKKYIPFDEVQVPSNIPITIIKKRLFDYNDIEISNEQLMEIKNGLENVLKIKYNGEVIDTIKFNVKDEYYNTVMEKITYISLDKRIKEGLDKKNG